MHGTDGMTLRLAAFRSISMILFALALPPASAMAGDLLYVTNSDTDMVSVIDGEKGAVVREVKVGTEPCDVAIDPKGELIAVSHEERRGEVTFLNRKDLSIQSKALLVEPEKGRASCFYLAFSTESKKLYAANRYSGSLYVVDVQKSQVVKEISLPHGKSFRLEGAVLSPDGALLYLPNGVGREIFVVDTERDKTLESIDIGGDASAIAFSPDGGRLYVANGLGQSLDVIDIKTRAVIKSIPVGNHPVGIAVSRDGSFIYVSNKMSYDVDKIDAALLRKTANIPVGMYPYGIAVGSGGKKVYVCNYNENTVSIIDTASAKEILRVATDSTPLKIAVYSEP